MVLLADLAASEEAALDLVADEADVAVDDVGGRSEEADEREDGDADEDDDEVCTRTESARRMQAGGNSTHRLSLECCRCSS